MYINTLGVTLALVPCILTVVVLRILVKKAHKFVISDLWMEEKIRENCEWIWNLKVLYYPVYGFLVLVSFAFLNPFLLAFIWVPMFCSWRLLCFTGKMNEIICDVLCISEKITQEQTKKLKKRGYIFFVDIISTHLQLRKCGKKEKKER